MMTEDQIKNNIQSEPADNESLQTISASDNSSQSGLDDEKASNNSIAKELTEQKDKYLRLVAEFDNYKKRTIKERIELIRNASQELIQELIVVLDDFDRAKRIAEEQNKAEIFPEGMRLVHHKLWSLLQSKGLEAMDTDGKTFDPQFHEAITEIPATTENMKGKIFDTIEKGYLLNQKIIRFAKVVVAK